MKAHTSVIWIKAVGQIPCTSWVIMNDIFLENALKPKNYMDLWRNTPDFQVIKQGIRVVNVNV